MIEIRDSNCNVVWNLSAAYHTYVTSLNRSIRFDIRISSSDEHYTYLLIEDNYRYNRCSIGIYDGNHIRHIESYIRKFIIKIMVETLLKR